MSIDRLYLAFVTTPVEKNILIDIYYYLENAVSLQLLYMVHILFQVQEIRPWRILFQLGSCWKTIMVLGEFIMIFLQQLLQDQQ